ncbi:hypothetical protein EVAR_53342_1 [Eumeta japonica]|uniref:Uncharacterized protein n=1 Tax=Eumeta variegata TaxID=151549 RepID=A0A4C1X5Y8_EUMVA|nr:hypothetical protein EVAR_53342_1 [Eumeta japonica]
MIRAAVAEWSALRLRIGAENPNYDHGYFGPWRMCKRLLYNREKCGADVSKFRPSPISYNCVQAEGTFALKLVACRCRVKCRRAQPEACLASRTLRFELSVARLFFVCVQRCLT